MSCATQIMLASALILLGSAPDALAQKHDSTPSGYKLKVDVDTVLLNVSVRERKGYYAQKIPPGRE